MTHRMERAAIPGARSWASLSWWWPETRPPWCCSGGRCLASHFERQGRGSEALV